MKQFFLVLFVVLSGCQHVTAPEPPTDGPCGPGAWIIVEGPDGSIECKRDGW